MSLLTGTVRPRRHTANVGALQSQLMSTPVAVPLIPMKSLAAAKGRLAPALGPIERRLLAIAMLEDVLDAVRATVGLARPVVVSPDREVWHRADALGCVVVEEKEGGDLNAALRLAAMAAGTNGPVTDGPGTDGAGMSRAAGTAGSGATALLVVAADLPLATAEALGHARDALARGAPVVVAPSRDGAGTNVLGWADPTTFVPEFGDGSAKRHLSIPGAVRVDHELLALDVDTVDDLRLAIERLDPGSVTGRRVRDLRLRERLMGEASA
jgi:2-phospho-L-lactate guanylyltransferase